MNIENMPLFLQPNGINDFSNDTNICVLYNNFNVRFSMVLSPPLVFKVD